MWLSQVPSRAPCTEPKIAIQRHTILRSSSIWFFLPRQQFTSRLSSTMGPIIHFKSLVANMAGLGNGQRKSLFIVRLSDCGLSKAEMKLKAPFSVENVDTKAQVTSVNVVSQKIPKLSMNICPMKCQSSNTQTWPTDDSRTPVAAEAAAATVAF